MAYSTKNFNELQSKNGWNTMFFQKFSLKSHKKKFYTKSKHCIKITMRLKKVCMYKQLLGYR